MSNYYEDLISVYHDDARKALSVIPGLSESDAIMIGYDIDYLMREVGKLQTQRMKMLRVIGNMQKSNPDQEEINFVNAILEIYHDYLNGGDG